VIIWWSVEDEAYVVDVPELPGCMAHGATPQTAIKDAEDNVKAHRFLADTQHSAFLREPLHSAFSPGGLYPIKRMAASILAAFFMVQRHPNVQLAGRADVAVEDHGITADHQILNLP